MLLLVLSGLFKVGAIATEIDTCSVQEEGKTGNFNTRSSKLQSEWHVTVSKRKYKHKFE